MKNTYFKLTFVVLVLMQFVGLKQANAQKITSIVSPCSCDEFQAQVVPTTASNGKCCYLLQIRQQYSTASGCKPHAIQLSPASVLVSASATVTVNNPDWQPAPAYGQYSYEMPGQPVLPSSNTWSTVATVCFPATGQPIPTMLVRWLSGDLPPAELCGKKIDFPICPKDSCRKGCLTPKDPWFCDRGATTIRALYCDDGTPINTTNITWYRAPFLLQCPASPTSTDGTMTAAELLAWGGGPFQTSGNTATTSSPLLTQSTCYIAYVYINATCHYWTSPTTVYVYPSPVISIQNREICEPTLAIPNNSQTYTVSVGTGQSIQWFRSLDCINYGSPVSTTSTFNTGILNGDPGMLNGNCDTAIYCYRVVLTSLHCGTVSQDFTVTVFRQPNAGALTATPNTVCNGKAATITRTGGCGKIIRWERSSYSNNYTIFSGWTIITPPYGTADNFSTNNLQNLTNCVRYIAYRVTVENGPCGQVTSNPVIVQVLPDLKPTISTAPPGVVCINPGSVTMTCNLASCPPPLYPVPPVTYTWYRDIPTSGVASGQTFTTMQPGTYWVTASNICGTWRSLPVTFCQKPTLKVPDGCICRRPPANGTYNLTVQIIGGCSNCTYNIQWRNKKNAGWLFNGTATGLTSGSNTITIPASKIPLMGYGDLLHFEVTVTGTSCGFSCFPNPNPVTNTIKVCPQ